MNNHADAESVANALELKQLLKEPIAGDYHPALIKQYPALKGIVPVASTQDLLAPVIKR